LPFVKNIDRLRPSGIVTATMAVPPATARGDCRSAFRSAMAPAQVVERRATSSSPAPLPACAARPRRRTRSLPQG
jgi:hypothetical protein